MSGTGKSLVVFAAVAIAGTALGWLLFDMAPRAHTPGSSFANHSPEAAELHRVCMAAPDATSPEHVWAFQRAFCQCNAEIAVEEMEPIDLRIVLAHKDGDAAAAEVRATLSDAELAAHVERLFTYQRKIIPHCVEVGNAAKNAARKAM